MIKAEVYNALILEAGVLGFPETDDNILLEKQDIAKFVQSAEGVPITIGHDKDFSKKENFVGYVSNSFMNEHEGRVSFLVFDEEAQNLLKNGYGVSFSFLITEDEKVPKKTFYNGVAYDRKITEIEGAALSIVPRGRFTNGQVRKNGDAESDLKTNNLGKIMSFFKNKNLKENELPSEKEKFLMVGSEKMTTEQVISKYKEKINLKQNEEVDAEDCFYQENDSISIDGVDVSVSKVLEILNPPLPEEETTEKPEELDLKENSAVDTEEKVGALEQARIEARKANKSATIFVTPARSAEIGKSLFSF